MAPKLYMIRGSPPCRSVFATAKALNISLNMHNVDFEKREHFSPEFLKVKLFFLLNTLIFETCILKCFVSVLSLKKGFKISYSNIILIRMSLIYSFVNIGTLEFILMLVICN